MVVEAVSPIRLLPLAPLTARPAERRHPKLCVPRRGAGLSYYEPIRAGSLGEPRGRTPDREKTSAVRQLRQEGHSWDLINRMVEGAKMVAVQHFGSRAVATENGTHQDFKGDLRTARTKGFGVPACPRSSLSGGEMLLEFVHQR